uniref:Uncharacterized protein n=1 Tax=Candidatus Kentrum eta TaxID=2126337 RepID=A0A450VLQ3_9GAMM|nr:MAG: hypothetical protein BECKH772B_GA0070898_103075 [Candidatus Kentron sp. H]VFK03081.1 MAG: hypothetical protein BECKH772A_GA0070896_103062 [Candidatus Kentron sp. H]VFK05738.1 MAG: hypothetical protein BECKH772C_GA0070978_102992 [Candidatus Kentron sp. H]
MNNRRGLDFRERALARRLHPTLHRLLLLLLRPRPEGLHEVEQEFGLPGNVRIGVGEFPDPAGGIEHAACLHWLVAWRRW